MRRLEFASLPALVTGVALSVAITIGTGLVWVGVGADVRARVSPPQAITLIGFWLVIVVLALAVGSSRVWANEDGVTTRNVLRVARFDPRDIVAVRLRPSDPWACLVVHVPGGEPRRHAILAIQSLEGAAARSRVEQLRAWIGERQAEADGRSDTRAEPDDGESADSD